MIDYKISFDQINSRFVIESEDIIEGSIAVNIPNSDKRKKQFISLFLHKADVEEGLDFLHCISMDKHIQVILSQINYWISCKNMGRFNEVREEIEAKDFSAMDISVRMAKEMLLENYKTAIPLLDEALLTGMTPNMVETWPLFIQFRKTGHYKEFQRKYAKELEHQIINPEDLTESMRPDKADELHDLKHAFKEEADSVEENATELPETNIT